MKTIIWGLSHLGAAALTVIEVTLLYLLFTVPIVAVFIIDDAFDPAEYGWVLFVVIASLIGFSLFICFPAAWLGERLTQRSGWFWIGYPLALWVAGATVFGIHWIFTGLFIDSLSTWAGAMIGLVLLVMVYWVNFGGLRLVVAIGTRLIQWVRDRMSAENRQSSIG